MITHRLVRVSAHSVTATLVFLLTTTLWAHPAAAVNEATWKRAASQLAPVLADRGEPGAKHVPGQALVTFRSGISAAVAEQYLSSIGFSVVERFAVSPAPMYLVGIPISLTVSAAVDLLLQSPDVAGASPNSIGRADATVTGRSRIPDDPEFSQQWGLNNTGLNLPAPPAPTPGRPFTNTVGIIDGDIDAPQAWRHSFDCSNEVVAVMDAGVDFAHPDLAGNVWVNPGETPANSLDDDTNAVIDDINGANFTSYETLFERREMHADNVIADGLFDAGEAIYLDADYDGVVSAPDVLLNGVAQAAGTGLVLFTASVKHAENVAANSAYDGGEAIYFDANNDDLVDGGDFLLQGPAQGNGTALIQFRVRDGVVQPSDSIYIDTDSTRTVTAPDTLLTGPAAPNGGTFDLFLPAVKHAENVAANGIYDNGEAIYSDTNNNNQVDAGEPLMIGPAQANGTALVPFVRRPNGDVRDVSGHGTNVASVIGARGDNTLNIAGVCWRVQLLALKVGTPDGFPSADFIVGLMYVRNLKTRAMNPVNVRIVNYSASGPSFNPAQRAELANVNTDGMLFVTTAGNTNIDDDGAPEVIYRDVDADGMVSDGDQRLTGVRDGGVNFPADSPVAAGDGDVGRALVAFMANERHAENIAANGRYDQGEFVYRSAGVVVAAGDTRLSRVSVGGQQFGEGTVVAGVHPDVGIPLIAFLANERHIDRVCDDASATPCTNNAQCVAVGGTTCSASDGLMANFHGRKPCTYDLPNILCVGATDNRDNLAAFSGWGVFSVDLAAPGVDILMLRRLADGGGTMYDDGTSFAAPMAAGIAAHFWSLAGFETHTVAELKDRLLTGLNGPLGLPHPNGVDPRFGVKGFVLSGITHDGRGRMTMGDDFGDAPDPLYPTILDKPLQNGARHEDINEEWLGRTADIPPAVLAMLDPPTRAVLPGDVGPEFDALDDPLWPPDPDGVGNIAPLVDRDRYDDGVEFLTPLAFSQPGNPKQATVRVFIATQNNGVVDFAGGRYDGTHPAGDGVHGPFDDENIWVNGFFDWNANGSFEDLNEQMFVLRAEPSTWGAKGAVYEITFDMPMAPPGVPPVVTWSRFRLDYGENVGQSLAPFLLPTVVGPSPGGTVRLWTDGLPLGGPTANLYESFLYPFGVGPQTLDLSRGLAQFGEVEDLRAVLLPHFQCYETHRPPLNREGVSLVDQFGASIATIKRSKRICAPANKNDEDPAAPLLPEHLTTYTLKQTSPRFTPVRDVTVTNQFGSLVVDLVKPDRLLVPTAKSLQSSPLPLITPTDHFKCYRVKSPRFRRTGDAIQTQFGTLVVDIKRPLHLCAPVNKNGEGIMDPFTHLMCYQVRGPRPQVPDEVFTFNQFGPDDYAVFGARELCVPSTKALPVNP